MIIIEGPQPRTLNRSGRVSLAIGTALALLASAVPFIRFVSNYLTILIHEMGHALTGWAFGYPSIPAFDFQYGGGVTMHGQQNWLIACLPIGLLVWLGWNHRSNVSAAIAWSTLALLMTVAALTPSIHQSLFVAMGHGTELIIASVFLYRALSGSAIKTAAERPLYAACALFVFIQCIRFGYGLATDPIARLQYAEAKGGGHWMDFSRLGAVLGLEVQTMGGLFVGATIVVMVLTFVAFRYRDHLAAGLVRILGAEH